MASLDFFRNPTNTTTTFFDEGPKVVVTIRSLMTGSPGIFHNTGSIKTSDIDGYRQGIELTRQKHFDGGTAKIYSGEAGHIVKQNTFGYGFNALRSERPFYDIGIFDPVSWVANTDRNVPKLTYLSSIHFDTYALGAASTLSSELSFSRTTVATVQTSVSTLVTGIGIDVARIGLYGLVIEPSFVQYCHQNRDMAGTSWLAGSTTTNTSGLASPDGTSNARRQAWAAGFSAYINSSVMLPNPVPTSTRMLSVWIRANSGVGQAYQLCHANTSGTSFALQGECDTTWRRIYLTRAYSNSGIGLGSFDGRGAVTVAYSGGNVSNVPQDIHIDLWQWEDKTYPSEVLINTAAASATSGGDRLWYNNASSIITNGRLSLDIEVVMKCSIGGNNDNANIMYVWFGDASNYVTIDNTTGIFTIVINGFSYSTTSGFLCRISDRVKIYVAAGGGVLPSYAIVKINDGAVKRLESSPAPATKITGLSTIDICCRGTATQLPCSIVYIEAHKSGQEPAWATSLVSSTLSTLVTSPQYTQDFELRTNNLYDGVIEPLMLRGRDSSINIPHAYNTHTIKGYVGAGNIDKNGVDSVQTMFQWNLRQTDAFYDLNVNAKEFLQKTVVPTTSIVTIGQYTYYRATISPFLDTRYPRNVLLSSSYDSTMNAALSLMSGSTSNYIANIYNQRSCTKGFDFDSNITVGTDSIAFGGQTF